MRYNRKQRLLWAAKTTICLLSNVCFCLRSLIQSLIASSILQNLLNIYCQRRKAKSYGMWKKIATQSDMYSQLLDSFISGLLGGLVAFFQQLPILNWSVLQKHDSRPSADRGHRSLGPSILHSNQKLQSLLKIETLKQCNQEVSCLVV